MATLLSTADDDNCKLLSVVVPLKNKEREIGRCIESILSQTYSNFEIIIVDGNSTDKSLDIALSYHDKRIRVLNQKSKGAAAGRNEGIIAAKGELIAFLDADDEYLPEFLDIIVRLSKKYPKAGMYGTSGRVVANGVTVATLGSKMNDTDYVTVNYFEDVSLHGDVSTSGVAVLKSVFSDVGMFNEELIWYEDVEMFARIGYAYPVARSGELGYVYHLIASNKITDSIPILPNEHPIITFLQRQPLDKLMSRADWSYIPPYISSLHVKFAGAQLLSGDKKGARNSLIDARLSKYHIQKHVYYMISYFPSSVLRWLNTKPDLRYQIREMFRRFCMD